MIDFQIIIIYFFIYLFIFFFLFIYLFLLNTVAFHLTRIAPTNLRLSGYNDCLKFGIKWLGHVRCNKKKKKKKKKKNTTTLCFNAKMWF